jgi:plastocyanin
MLLAAGLALGCESRGAHPAYVPQVREITLTAVPLLTKELQSVYPFLRDSFAPNGVLDGKEIYAFVPSTVTVVEGDTIHFTLVNPEDDEHKFVLEDLVVDLPGQTVNRATYLAHSPGVFTFSCVMPTHVPYMYGQLVVLPAAAGR